MDLIKVGFCMAGDAAGVDWLDGFIKMTVGLKINKSVLISSKSEKTVFPIILSS